LIDRVEENDSDSVSVSWLPVIHDMGLIEGVLAPAYAGYPAYLMAPATFLQRPLRWLRAITKYRATNSGGPNFAYDLCARKVNADQLTTLDLSSWRVAYNGAEPIRSETLTAFYQAFRACGFRWNSFYPVYGLAESTLVVTSGRRTYQPVFFDADASALCSGRIEEYSTDPSSRPVSLVSSGPATADTRLLIVDPDTFQPCAPRDIGEIWISSPSVTKGYWRREEETSQTFGAMLANGRGPYLRTGDLGVLIEGELFVAGRLKDLLIVRGLKHYPQDLELTIERQHPAIRPGCVAVFSLESHDECIAVAAELDPRSLSTSKTNAPALTSLLHESKDVISDLIVRICQAVAEIHGVQLHTVALLKPGALPKTSSGKIRHRACAQALCGGQLAEVARWIKPNSDSLTMLQRAGYDDSDLPPHDKLVAFKTGPTCGGCTEHSGSQCPSVVAALSNGMDSLAAAELTALIEDEFNHELPPALLFEYPTLESLWRFIELRIAGSQIEESDKETSAAEMLADAILPSDIVPASSQSQVTDVLLTGSTGFVGAYLLRSLLRDTSAMVYCLVRTTCTSAARVRQNLEQYGLWEDHFASRIRCVYADLTQPGWE
jgi:acyl-coenzyme A synthetase/AMP-(fatty) acid ligase